MKMCRPKFLPSEKRVTRLKNVFDLNFYRQLVTQNPQEILTEKLLQTILICQITHGFIW